MRCESAGQTLPAVTGAPGRAEDSQSPGVHSQDLPGRDRLLGQEVTTFVWRGDQPHLPGEAGVERAGLGQDWTGDNLVWPSLAGHHTFLPHVVESLLSLLPRQEVGRGPGPLQAVGGHLLLAQTGETPGLSAVQFVHRALGVAASQGPLQVMEGGSVLAQLVEHQGPVGQQHGQQGLARLRLLGQETQGLVVGL